MQESRDKKSELVIIFLVVKHRSPTESAREILCVQNHTAFAVAESNTPFTLHKTTVLARFSTVRHGY